MINIGRAKPSDSLAPSRSARMKTEIKEMPEKPAFDTPMQYAAMMTSNQAVTPSGVVGSMKQYGQFMAIFSRIRHWNLSARS